MGEVVDISRYAKGRDRKLLGEIVESAQLAQAFARYERSFFLASPDDQRKIADRLVAMGDAARKLSRAVRERTAHLPWDELIAAGDAAREREPDPAALWTAVKKIVPKITSGLAPVAGDAGSVFAWTPPPSTRAGSRGRRRGSPPSGREDRS